MAALNIAVNPHPKGIYEKMFQEAKRKEIEVSFRGKDKILVRRFKKENEDIWVGSFYKFTSTEQWVNRETLEDGKIETEGYDANAELYDFVLFPKSHKLVFESKDRTHTLSPTSLETALRALLHQTSFARNLESLSVNTIKDSSVVDRIRESKSLMKLRMMITRPNTDSPKVFEDILNELDDMGASKLDETYAAEKGNVLKVTSRLNNHIGATEINGFAEAVLHNNEGRSIELRTRKWPLQSEVEYDPKDNVSRRDFMQNALRKFAEKFDLNQ